jgi:hypothetical protein
MRKLKNTVNDGGAGPLLMVFCVQLNAVILHTRFIHKFNIYITLSSSSSSLSTLSFCQSANCSLLSIYVEYDRVLLLFITLYSERSGVLYGERANPFAGPTTSILSSHNLRTVERKQYAIVAPFFVRISAPRIWRAINFN